MATYVQEKTLVNIIRKSINEYLKNTSFGLSSVWTHGEAGKVRANRIATCINTDSLEKKPSLIWEILYAIYLTKSTRLKKMITEQIIHNGILGIKLRSYVANYEGKMDLEDAQQKGITDMSVEKIKNINSTRISTLRNYFDQNDNVNEQALTLFFDISVEKY